MGSFAKTLPNLSLARPGLDRLADRRTADGLLPTLLSDAATRVLELRGDRADVVEDGADLRLVLRPPQPRDLTRLGLFLGADGDDAAYVAVVTDPPTEAGDHEDDGHTLREVGALLGDRDAALFTTALALANWHRVHPFCARCGAPTEPASAGWLRRCTREGSEHYPRTDVAVIMSVVDPDDRLLMARGAGWGEGRFSVLAGFLEPGESLAGAVAREVREEVGLEVHGVEYLGDQAWPFPSSLMVGFTARATTAELTLQESEIAEARWYTREELLAAVADGSLTVSSRVSIARRIVEHWLGHEIADVP
ncbi:NAD(+) diphosphatase [Pedococcus aerophilus]|uniref:NAD(+) diphosphatase n=1 Tax=Pedococcus aerophilus TaxID=436356 RepID=A0ABN3UIZ0_9MICO